MDSFTVILSCLSWLPALWKQLATSTQLALTPRGPSVHLPDEILLQILTKLPAKSVIVCRCVCRRWKTLTSALEFLELHHKNRLQTIVVEQWNDSWDRKYKISIVDEWGATKSTTRTHQISLISVNPVPKSSYPQYLLYSSNGLLIFLEEFQSTSKLRHFILFNPITRQKVRLITPRGSIYGVFFHPLFKDQYCVLWGGEFLRNEGSVQYKTLVLGSSKSQSRTKKSYWRELYDNDRPVSVLPRYQTPPVMVNDILYWMVGSRYATSKLGTIAPGTMLCHYCPQSIMAFDTKTEKFSVMGHPGPRDQRCKEDPEHQRMNLVEMDDHGILCLGELTELEKLINIWILKQEDVDRSVWILRYTINVDLYIRRSPFSASDKNYWVQPVAFVEGELYVVWRGRGLFALNLMMGTAKRFERRIWNEYGANMYAHTPCLMPIRNCKSEIWM